MFCISFVRDTATISGSSSEVDHAHEALGILVLNDFNEHFISNVDYWSETEYEAQWRDGLRRICNGAPSSCLLTNVFRPETANFIELWALFRNRTNVVFQNRLLFLDQIRGEFVFNRVYEYIAVRAAYSEEGLPVSEWVTDLSDIENFLES